MSFPYEILYLTVHNSKALEFNDVVEEKPEPHKLATNMLRCMVWEECCRMSACKQHVNCNNIISDITEKGHSLADLDHLQCWKSMRNSNCKNDDFDFQDNLPCDSPPKVLFYMAAYHSGALVKPIGSSLYQCHHIVAGRSKVANLSRTILRNAKIPINHPLNGIFLPRRTRYFRHEFDEGFDNYHQNHYGTYDIEVLTRLLKIANISINPACIDEKTKNMIQQLFIPQKKVFETLDGIKKDIISNKILLHKN